MAGDMEFDELAPPTRVRHIKKRALKNKSLSVSFNEKDLRDFVGGFQKRKKKRRKEAQKQQEEVLRKKRIEARKKRKLDEQFVMGAVDNEENEEDEEEVQEEEEPDASVSGTTTYDTGELKVTVTTSDISREDEVKENLQQTTARSVSKASTDHPMAVRKTKSFKKVKKHKSRSKTIGKREKVKRSRQNKKLR